MYSLNNDIMFLFVFFLGAVYGFVFCVLAILGEFFGNKAIDKKRGVK